MTLDDYLGIENPTPEQITDIRRLCKAAIADSTPGRYEGESRATAWFDMMAGNGLGDYGDCDCGASNCDDADGDSPECSPDCGSNDSIFDISPTDRAIFPELADASRFRIHVTDTGFVCGPTED